MRTEAEEHQSPQKKPKELVSGLRVHDGVSMPQNHLVASNKDHLPCQPHWHSTRELETCFSVQSSADMTTQPRHHERRDRLGGSALAPEPQAGLISVLKQQRRTKNTFHARHRRN